MLPGRVGVFVDGGDGPGRHREGARVRCGGFAQPVELGRPGGEAVAGHQRGDPAVAEFGGHPDRVLAQRGDPDGQLGDGRLAQAQRARRRGVAELGGLAGEQRTDLGHDVAQLGGRVLERGVVEPLRQCPGAGAQAQHVTPAADLVEGGGGHRQRRRGASPDRQDAGGDLDPGGAQRDLGQHRGRVQPPALGHREGLVPQLVGEHGGPDDDIPPGLHRREPHAAAAGGHDALPAASAAGACPGAARSAIGPRPRRAPRRRARAAPTRR